MSAPLLGGGSVSNWFAYAVALAFLLIRPAGLFGESGNRKGLGHVRHDQAKRVAVPSGDHGVPAAATY